MEVKHRIVSIDRPYIRPIVRGKENKRVEFGAKVNNRQNDGIPFIEHHSFETFNEGVRLKESIIIGTLRSTVMEGSFGNQKQHYKVVAYSGTKLPQRDTAALFRPTMRKRGYTCCPTTCNRRKAEATKKTAGIVTP